MGMNDQYAIRRQNFESIWNALIRQKRATRQSLADETKLSLMTVGNFVALLDERNVLVKTQDASPVKLRARRPLGRRVQWVEIASDRCGWVVINLTGLDFRAHRLKLNAEPYGPEIVHEYNRSLPYEQNLLKFLSRAGMLEGAGDALGVAVIAPGPYDVATDTVRNARIPDLNHVRIKNTLRAALPCRCVFVEEDVKLSVRAFLPRANTKNGDMLAYLYMGEGVGGAIAYQGDVLRGRNAVAGDFGQTIADSGMPYESELTVGAFARRLAIEEGKRTDELLRLIDARALDETKKAAYASHAEILGRMIRNMMWSVDPTRVVIECLYAQGACDTEYFSERTLDAVTTQLSGSTLNLPDIQFARASQPSVLYGAVQALSRQWIDEIVTGGREEEITDLLQKEAAYD